MRDDEDYKDDRPLSRSEALEFLADIEYQEYLALQEHVVRLEQWAEEAARALARKDKKIKRLEAKLERHGVDPDER